MENKVLLKIYHKRYIQNKYLELDSSANTSDQIFTFIEKHLLSFLNENLISSPPDSLYVINSLNEKLFDNSIYVGTGSNCYIYWRYYLLCKNKYTDLKDISFTYFESSILKNLSNIKSIESKNKFSINKIPVSFFMGHAGIYTLSCIYFHILNDKSNFKICLNNLLKYFENSCSKDMENELLYGNAGYLYCLLLIKQNCQDYIKDSLDDYIFKLINVIYLEGVKYRQSFKSECLLWPFPKKNVHKIEDIYIGAAHGIFGILYMLIKGIQIMSGPNQILKFDKNIEDDIKITLDYLIKIKFKSGNFPADFGDTSDKLLHFCHGATGAIPLYLLSYEFFNKDEYLNSALEAGETLWLRGLLLKGNSICHGISGGSYSLNSLYRFTQDTKWKNRSFLFAFATFDEDIQSIVKQHDDPQRNVTGISDIPFSLMEGNGGVVSLFSDLLNDSEFVKFPGYEI
jgi:hypothetical protein